MDASDVAKAVDAAQATFETFRKIPARDRARMLRAYNDVVLAHKEDLATIIVAENGKPRR